MHRRPGLTELPFNQKSRTGRSASGSSCVSRLRAVFRQVGPVVDCYEEPQGQENAALPSILSESCRDLECCSSIFLVCHSRKSVCATRLQLVLDYAYPGVTHALPGGQGRRSGMVDARKEYILVQCPGLLSMRRSSHFLPHGLSARVEALIALMSLVD